VVDALSRRAHEVHAIAIIMYQSYLKDQITEASKLDLHYKELVAKVP
jgi:hypothetical protein